MGSLAQSSWQELWLHYANRVERLCLSLLGRRDWAEDAVQETALRLAQTWDKFRGDSAPSTWLYGLTRNVCREILRKELKYRSRESELNDEFVAESQEADADYEVLKKALGQLDEKFRAPLLLVLSQGLSVEDVSRMLKIPEGTVKSRIHGAKAKLARFMNQIEEDSK